LTTKLAAHGLDAQLPGIQSGSGSVWWEHISEKCLQDYPGGNAGLQLSIFSGNNLCHIV